MGSADTAYKMMDQHERDRLITEQLPQVRYIARRIHERLPQHVQLEDLVHAGVLGLIDAVHKYDSTKQVQFKSYAKFRIRGAILDSLRELDWSPRDLRRKARRIEEATASLNSKLGRAASETEIAAELHIDVEELHHILGELGGLDLGSLQIESASGGEMEDLCEYVAGNPEESPYFLCLQSEMKSALARAIGELGEKEQQVLSLYYFEELTMKEVGEVLGVGESRVSQIHSLALVRLRARMQELLVSKMMPGQTGHLVDALLEASWKRC
ncbi:MAG: FliA/WhiG family RNA polymerase sigma factor [Terriglobia bacterium]|jgi:RNA polymerase sigma factor for flagellar operon FliA|nr:FliA/WhiG family RNA polymerase sigma factor [Terriglobia bacterium]